MTEERTEDLRREHAASLEERQLATRCYLVMMEEKKLLELHALDRARLRGYVLSGRTGRA